MSDIPELAPLLGGLAAPDGAAPRHWALEPVRVELLTALFDRAGQARALLAQGDARGAHIALGREAWLGLWEKTTTGAAAKVIGTIERRLREAAVVSRIGAKRLAATMPRDEDRRVLAARLSAAGIGLERATSGLGEDPEIWDEALRRSAGELAGAWDALIELASQELATWERRIVEVRAWRRPWRPLLLTGTAVVVLAGWIGLTLGGFLPVPGFLRPLTDWYWSAGWP